MLAEWYAATSAQRKRFMKKKLMENVIEFCGSGELHAN